MKFLLPFFILITTLCFSQNDCLKTVLDAKDKTPVPFAIVQVDKAFFYTDSLGRFNISEKVEKGVLVKIMCMGYESAQFTKSDTCKITIYLIPKSLDLAEITIKPLPPKIINLGLTTKTLTSASVLGGEIITTFIPNESATQKIVKKIVFPYRSRTENVKDITSCLRFHLYSVGANKRPDRDLIEQNLIFCPKKIKDKVEIDVRKFSIIIPPEGIFVGVEWVASDKTATDIDGYQLTNDFGAYISNKELRRYPSFEKTISTFMDWGSFQRPKTSIMSAHIGLEIEER
jgi:hypothetical protein